jgi:hypothetical protein
MKSLPNEISVGYSIYLVRVYVPGVMRCFKCQRLGHRVSDCRGAMRCVRCGGSHGFDKRRTHQFVVGAEVITLRLMRDVKI